MHRNVMIDGVVYADHELREMDALIADKTIVRVDSTNDGIEWLPTHHDIPWQDGMTVAQAEALTWALPFFDEYIDEGDIYDKVLDMLTDEQAEQVPEAFHEWAPNYDYKAGDRRRYKGVLYKCLQAHTSQVGWEPDIATSLWAKVHAQPDPPTPGDIPVWEQPSSTNPYMMGDKVHFPTIDDPVYVSTIDYNVYAPDVYGWELEE